MSVVLSFLLAMCTLAVVTFFVAVYRYVEVDLTLYPPRLKLRGRR